MACFSPRFVAEEHVLPCRIGEVCAAVFLLVFGSVMLMLIDEGPQQLTTDSYLTLTTDLASGIGRTDKTFCADLTWSGISPTEGVLKRSGDADATFLTGLTGRITSLVLLNGMSGCRHCVHQEIDGVLPFLGFVGNTDWHVYLSFATSKGDACELPGLGELKSFKYGDSIGCSNTNKLLPQ